MRGLLLRQGREGKGLRDEGEEGGEGKRGGEGRGERRREGRGGLSGNVAEEALCLKSAPATASLFRRLFARLMYHFAVDRLAAVGSVRMGCCRPTLSVSYDVS